MRVGPGSCHTTISARDTDLRKPAYLRNLKNKLIPGFLRLAGIKKLSKNGMRMVIDVVDNNATIHLMAGSATPNPCPQDWLEPRGTVWDPKDKNAQKFFIIASQHASEGKEKTLADLKIFHTDADKEVFGVENGDPKAETHFLMLTTENFATMIHQGFSDKLWSKYFEGAYQILRTLGVQGQPTRFVVNFGMGFQATPRVHMHVQVSPKGLTSLDPKDYGFMVNDDGSVKAPEGSQEHQVVIDLFNKRKKEGGFDPLHKAIRRAIDMEMEARLEMLRIR